MIVQLYYFCNAGMKSPGRGNLSEKEESHGFREISVPHRAKAIAVGPSLCQQKSVATVDYCSEPGSRKEGTENRGWSVTFKVPQ